MTGDYKTFRRMKGTHRHTQPSPIWTRKSVFGKLKGKELSCVQCYRNPSFAWMCSPLCLDGYRFHYSWITLWYKRRPQWFAKGHLPWMWICVKCKHWMDIRYWLWLVNKSFHFNAISSLYDEKRDRDDSNAIPGDHNTSGHVAR